MFNPYSELYGNFVNRTFADIFPSAEDFVQEYKDSALYSDTNKISNPELLFYLLYARYGNSVIASYDENQFKYKVFSTIFMYGPSWEKRLEVQSKVRGLSEEEIIKGSKRINNMSYNPSTAPTTNTLEELTTINQQFTDGWKKSKLEGYSTLLSLIETDVTEEFIGKFKKLFIVVVQPNLPLWYETEKE
jgi:hypothetical protein